MEQANDVSTSVMSASDSLYEKEMVITYEQQRKKASAIGWRYAIYALLVICIQFAVSFLIVMILPEWAEENWMFVSLLIIMVVYDFFGFLVVFVMTRFMEKTKIPKKKMGVGPFFVAILMTAGMMGAGSIIGNVLDFILSLPSLFLPTEETVNTIFDSGFVIRVLSIGICAPIFEELIFRKLLIDRTVKYGEFLAIVLSGLMFGLFHGNFSQFFFATFVGLFFAFIYVKTGNIGYTILLHMIVNLTTSIGTAFFANNLIDVLEKGPVNEFGLEIMLRMLIVFGFILWFVLLAIISFSGFVTLIVMFVMKKMQLNSAEEYLKKGKTLLAAIINPGFILFFLICCILFFERYIIPVFQLTFGVVKGLMEL